MVRIAVLVSGGGTNLQALIDAQGRGEIPDGQIAAVISSSPDAFALERAKKAGIPGYVINRKDFASNQAMTVAPVSYTHLDVYKRQDADRAVQVIHDKFFALS